MLARIAPCPSATTPGVIDVLLAAIDRAFDRKSWHGTNLRGSIRGLSAAQAAWRPGPGRHSIHEIVIHAAYWKYVVRRRIRGEKRGSFPRPGSNWWVVRGASESAWKEDVALLAAVHGSLREAVEALDPGDLSGKPPGGTTDCLALITGIAAHDVYHAGQIQLLKRLGTTAKWRPPGRTGPHHYRLGHKAEARRYLDQSIAWIAANPPPDWEKRAELEHFRAEAEGLIAPRE